MSHRRRDDRQSRSISFLVSMLVRYPEVATVKYEPREQSIRMGLLVNGDLTPAEFAELDQAFTDTLDVYHLIQQRSPAWVQLQQESYGELTAITITRDVRTFSAEEIYTIVEFFRERLAGRLMAEAVEFSGEEDLLAQDELIQEILDELDSGRSGQNLIAIREDGRVMVFQK